MLLRLAAAYAAGLFLPAPALPPSLVALCMGRRPRRQRIGWLPAVLLAALLGWCDRPVPGPAAPARVALHGWIAAAPEPTRSGTRAACVVEAVSKSLATSDPRSWRGRRVLLQHRGPLPPYGMRVAVRGVLRPPAPRRHFSPLDEAALLAAQGARAVVQADSVAVLPGWRGPTWRRCVIEPLRGRLREAIASVLAPREAGLLTALLVGARDGVDAATRDAWAALGTSHILSISGMHVALVATAALALGGSPVRARGLATLLGCVWGYAALGGLGPTVLRAALMATWGAIATWLGRDRRPLLALGTASLVLVFQDPSRRSDLGLQLSCLATAGLLVWATTLASWGARWAERGRGGRFAAWALASAGIGIGAQLATLPLTVAKFGALPLASPVANLLLVPLTDAALVLGLIGAPLALVSTVCGRPLLLLAGGLLHAGLRASDLAVAGRELRLFVRVDAATIAASCALAAAALAMGVLFGAGKRRRGIAAAGAAVLALVGLLLFGTRSASTAWRVEALDVGQGDAIVLGVGKNTWVVDAGDARPLDQGARVVLPHLRRAGVRRLRGLVLTHPHDDHSGGAASLLRSMAVDTLYLAAASRAHPAYAAFRAAAPGVPVRYLARGAVLALAPGYAATVLWPESTDVLEHGPNDCSVVLWAHGDGRPDLVLAGDLESAGEEQVLARWNDRLTEAAPRFLVLKVGHHGSHTSSSPAWLAALDPEVALLSVGARNRYGHPGARTLAALAARDAAALRTDLGGAVRLELRGATLWLERPAARARPLRCPDIQDSRRLEIPSPRR